MKFIVLQDNPEYYNIILPLFYQEWEETYNNININNIYDLKNYFMNKKKSKTWILINNKEQFLGSFTITKIDDKIFIENIYVVKELRKKDLGNYIIDNAINKSGTMNNEVYIYSKKKTLPFYLKKGFFVIKEIIKDDIYLLKYYIAKIDTNITIQCYILYGFVILILILLAKFYI
jgi:predicted GNAT family N-acyltransferase